MILIVEDEPIARRALRTLLSANGYKTEAVASAEEALRLLATGQVPQVALIDLNLPGMNGMDLIGYLERKYPGVRTVLVTAASPEALHEARDGRPVRFLRKPLNVGYLMSVLHEAPQSVA